MPAITKVERDHDDSGEADDLRITLFGVNKKLAMIDSYSSSGSGWAYGSAMTVRCKETNKVETLTEY